MAAGLVNAVASARLIASLAEIARFFGARTDEEMYKWCRQRSYVSGRTHLRVTNAGACAVEVLCVHGVGGEEELDAHVTELLEGGLLDPRELWDGTWDPHS